MLKCSSGILWPDSSAGKGEPGNARLVPKTPLRAQHLNDKVIEAMATQSLRTLGLAYRLVHELRPVPGSQSRDCYCRVVGCADLCWLLCMLGRRGQRVHYCPCWP